MLVTAPIKEPITVFLVGMQCRSFLSFWKVPLVGRRMAQMQEELRSIPDSGLIWGMNFFRLSPFTTLFLSYWKSSDHLNRFIHDTKFSHKQSVAEYWKRFGSDPNLGVWHETYEIDPAKTESLYFNMAPFGVSAFEKTEKVTGENKAFFARLRKG